MKHSDIPMTPVESSQIHAIGHDPATNTLRVQFNSKHGPGASYDYPGFTAHEFAEFMAAKSKGAFFGQHVKPRKDYTRVAEPPARAHHAA